jgi:periplasmic protein TonB
MAKLLSYISLSVIITFGLFAFMASLISSDSVNITPPLPPIVIEVAQVPEDSKIQIIEKVKLDPPPAPEPMPKSDVTPVVANDAIALAYQSVPISLTGKGTTFKQYEGMNNNEARPIVRVNPKYPMDAMREGTEGWVKLAFDINKVGKVVNISVIDSQPKRIFDKAARQALRKWKYQAKSVDGQAVYQKSRTVQLDFSMEQQS